MKLSQCHTVDGHLNRIQRKFVSHVILIPDSIFFDNSKQSKPPELGIVTQDLVHILTKHLISFWWRILYLDAKKLATKSLLKMVCVTLNDIWCFKATYSTFPYHISVTVPERTLSLNTKSNCPKFFTPRIYTVFLGFVSSYLMYHIIHHTQLSIATATTEKYLEIWPKDHCHL